MLWLRPERTMTSAVNSARLNTLLEEALWELADESNATAPERIDVLGVAVRVQSGAAPYNNRNQTIGRGHQRVALLA